ncbi:MAG: ATP-dependent zinc metalloprotease FtsH [Deltaproteobacteria bacterium]|nr:ATP-dependent zinc metalloprotease FtsH [Deltaproteobacteria bacterium]MBW2531997.1 ATP-dependent zinc metalloprotease FtsH [Deltaproteobacteria bacterium]
MVFLAIWLMLSPDRPPAAQESFSEFIALSQADKKTEKHIESVVVKDREYIYTVKDPKAGTETKKVAIGPDKAEAVAKDLVERGIKVTFEKEDASPFWSGALVTVVPMVLLLGMFYLFMRQLQTGGGKAMSFGKSRARMLNEAANKVTFEDVAGVDEAKDEVEEIIEFLKDPKKFQRLGGRIPKGVLMVGPPGTGKTLLARAIAGEAAVPFFSISGSDFVEMFVGVGASRVRDLFEQGKKHAPCIIFIDEIDAVGRHRGAGLGGGHDEREQTLNQLLVEMDGFESNEGVIIVAATNRPDVLDPAILRPGRFDRRITVPRPDVRGREAILGIHTRKVPLGPDVDLGVIARGTPGFVGADLENLTNEAALLAARQDKEFCTMVDFEMAKDKVLMGSERRSMVIGEEEKRTTAWHEAGHTLVAKLLGDKADPVHKVTIIPRGPALGLTQQLPKADRLSMSREFVRAKIAVLMGGRAAEEQVFGHYTTGAANDIKQATSLARRMVMEFGMSDAIGPVAFGGEDDAVFLGRDITTHKRDYSEATAQLIDREIKRFVNEAYQTAGTMVSEHRDKLDRMAEALLERETLDAEEIQALVDGTELPDRDQVKVPTYREQAEAAKEKRRAASIFGQPKPAPSV